MKIDLSLISSRLRQARESLSYSIEDISEEARIVADRLESIERAEIEPTGDELLILASLYRCEFRELIDPSLPPPVENTEILFRRYGESFGVEDRRSVQEFLFLCRIEKQLEQLLQVKKLSLPNIKSGGFYKGDGKFAAETLRKNLGLTNIPADVFKAFRSLGVHIFRRRLENTELSGLYINDKTAGHCVLINHQEDFYRQRFSVCHEVAHAIFDSNEGMVVSFESSSSKYSQSDLQEIRANSFAAHFLLPEEILGGLPRVDQSNAVEWAGKLMVSTSALAKALKDAKLADEETFKRIRAERVSRDSKVDPELVGSLSSKGKSQRDELMDRGLSAHYAELCFEALDKNLISAGRLSEILLIHHSDLGEIGALVGRSISHGM